MSVLSRFVLGCLAFLIGSSCYSAFAWNNRGHKVVASVVFRQLSPQQRNQIITILGQHPRFQQDFTALMPAAIKNGPEEDRQEWLFQQAAVWPDLVKDNSPGRKPFDRGRWHYINRPFFLTNADRDELEDTLDVNLATAPPAGEFDSPNMNVVQAIANSERIFASNSQLDSTKAIHICWLLHLIGDFHQPLHSTALFSRKLFPEGDRGGGKITTNPNGNLHSVWDSGIGSQDSFSDCRNAAISLLSSAENRQTLAQAAAQLEPAVWWDESYALATEFAYDSELLAELNIRESAAGNSFGNAIQLQRDYLNRRKAVCETAILKAGGRCAAYLIGSASTGDGHSPSRLAINARIRIPEARSGRAGFARELAASNNKSRAITTESVPQRLLTGDAAVANEGTPTASETLSSAPMRSPTDPCLAKEQPTPQIKFASFDEQFVPPEGVTPFELSQDYPQIYDVSEEFPWMKIDYRTNSISYLNAVLAYCLEGNLEVNFQGQNNATRKWYHAPWMDNDSKDKQKGDRQGREYHHGLTRERRSRAKELHPLQTTDRIQNWAVSLYSPRGGYTLGRVWRTKDGHPDPSRSTFPDNTVSFKLLFTAAPVAEVPFLKDSFTWTANINPVTPLPAGQEFRRVDTPVRLLQVDIAVKDPRVANESGWIFGTFVYDGSRPGTSPFQKLVPVGLSWADDSSEKNQIEKEGSFLNPYLRESVINAELIEPIAGTDWGQRAYLRHHGLGGRLNGPVDNPFSSCISCHGRAGTALINKYDDPDAGITMPILSKTGTHDGQKAAFDTLFKTIRPNSHLEQAEVELEQGRKVMTFVTVDYSLQVSQGILNFYQACALRRKEEEAAAANTASTPRRIVNESASPRSLAPNVMKPRQSRDEDDK